MAVYKVLEKVGEGGMGVVYRALQTSLDREVALKLLLDPDGARPHDLKRFSREVRAIARISHPNVIRILDYGTLEGKPFYAMEYLGTARTLSRVMKEGPLPIPRAIAITRQILDALAAVHRHALIHRDVKPGNIMVSASDHLTLMDFGLVKDTEASQMTREGMMIGTPRYLSPEAVQGLELDARSDLFSAGVLLHESVTGHRLFSGDTLPALAMQIVTATPPPLTKERRDCPPWLADLIAALLEKDPERRVPSALEALNRLREALGEGPQDPEPPAAPPSASGGDVLAASTVLGGFDAVRQALSQEVAEPEEPTERSPTPHPSRDDGGRTPAGGGAGAAPHPGATGSAAALAKTPRSTGTHGAVGGAKPSAGPRSRPTGSLAAVTPPSAPPATDARRIYLLAGLTAAVVFGLTLAAFLPRSSGPAAASASPSAASGGDAGPPQPLPLPSEAAAAAAAVRTSIESFAPATRLADLRALFHPALAHWFRPPLDPRLPALRAEARTLLASHADRARLPDLLARFKLVRRPFFDGPAVPPPDKRDLYVQLHELLDLELFCDRFGVGWSTGVDGAFHATYGELPEGSLAAQPAGGFVLSHPLTFKPFVAPSDPHDASWHILPTRELYRFHTSATPEASDLMQTLGEGPTIHLIWEPAEPLPVPLSRATALELSGWVSNPTPNLSFEITLLDDAGGRAVAVIRGPETERPRRFFHTVDRALFTGSSLRLRVRYRCIPDMQPGSESNQLYQVQVHYRS